MNEHNTNQNQINQPNKKLLSARARIVAAVGMTAGLALGSGAVSDYAERNSAPIYQPADLQPTEFGTEVPEGFQAPVGETITPDPSDPNQRIIHYGKTPEGRTFPDRVVPAPPTTTAN